MDSAVLGVANAAVGEALREGQSSPTVSPPTLGLGATLAAKRVAASIKRRRTQNAAGAAGAPASAAWLGKRATVMVQRPRTRFSLGCCSDRALFVFSRRDSKGAKACKSCD